MTTQGPTRHQILILDLATVELIVTNTASAVQSCNKGLVEACSKLRVESMCKAQNGVFMFTNSVISVAELEVIKQWLKKTTSLGENTKIEPHLSQSKSFLKIFFIHQFITWCSITVHGRLSTISSL